jgi:hypothetical protein
MNVARTKQVMDMNELHARTDETQTDIFYHFAAAIAVVYKKSKLSMN